ncbi:MAG: adenylyltransferase/cytidyltransferase family protein [Planctomycetes bacterium]|jgi:riboflavin kinase/FMN adenylyltransferase|nr:adenylyltransferase/cytidyltransferase family protein [Planctomycetota bacterium]
MRTRSVLTIGNFDGVHLGHRAILARARQLAAQRSARVIALTFDPHPAAVLRPGSQPPVLNSITRRVEDLMDAGADQVHLLKPTSDLLAQPPAAFVDRLVDEFSPVAIVEGPDFRFGKGRAGDLRTLRDLGDTRGFAVEAVPGVEVALSDQLQTVVSSSLVRWLVGRGRVADAAICLGQPYALDASVVRGEQRGRTIGIPTINLDLEPLADHIFPADGVYAGHAMLDGDPDRASFPAAISVGVKPTFGQRQLTIEAHLLGYTSDDPDALYGQAVRLSFARFLRDQYPFPGLDALVAQLRRDIARVNTLAGPAAVSA